jgi:hypothetical protein
LVTSGGVGVGSGVAVSVGVGFWVAVGGKGVLVAEGMGVDVSTGGGDGRMEQALTSNKLNKIMPILRCLKSMLNMQTSQ